MIIAIPKEIAQSEARVAITPSLITKLQDLGSEVRMQKHAGLAASYQDSDYQGVTWCDDATSLYQNADIILKVEGPTETEIALCKKNAIVIGLLSPSRFPKRILALKNSAITSFAMELIPRISRAQAMDVLSSQATVAGYKAVLLAANHLNRFFPMLTTAAGTIRPANVLVIGAGVAGLQAIATARRLGAIVKAYDIRSAAREQIESLGAKMINIDVKAESEGGYARELSAQEQQVQQDALQQAVAKAEVVICTAFLPGKPAPQILNQAMVDNMAPGSVIVDIAAISGGNCALTQADKIVQHQGVTILGPTNIASMVARDASDMYAKNIVNFLGLLFKDKKLAIDWDDPILAQSVLTHEGIIKHSATREAIEDSSHG